MNWQRIQYFLTFCETLHFTNAARQLGISQPALTKAISQLEEELGTRLIRREGKHTHLTGHGKSVRRKYSELTRSVQAIVHDVKNIVRGDDEKICVGISPPVDFTAFAGFLSDFHKHCPNAFIEITECSAKNSEELLLNGEVDCVLGVNASASSDRVVHIPLYENNLTMTTKSKPQTYIDHSKYDAYKHGIDKIDLEVLSTHIFSHSHKGDYVCIASCSQQLWVQNLLQAGLGFSMLSRDGAKIDGVSAVSDVDIVEKQITYAAVPVGRNDSRSFIVFVEKLKSYKW